MALIPKSLFKLHGSYYDKTMLSTMIAHSKQFISFYRRNCIPMITVFINMAFIIVFITEMHCKENEFHINLYHCGNK